nr:DUF4167 domain-containing protein [Bosea caraganae]
MRGRNNNNNNNNSSNNGNRKAPNPLQRSYESNGPDVKVRGTAQNIAEKYLQLARDAQSSGDPVAAENYFQHAEHYYRILLAAQEQMAQQYGHSFPPTRGFGDDSEEGEEEGDEDGGGFQQGAPQPDMRNQPQGGMNGNGYNANGGQRQDGEGGEGQQNNGQRFDRPNRGGERFAERPNNDRNNNNNRRFDRNDRGERRFDRPEGGQNGQPGNYAPRQDVPGTGEQPEAAPPPPPRDNVQPNPAERRFERGDRPERPERAPRPERRPRREAVVEDEANGDVPAGLPSFLTTPVRVPIAVAEEPVSVVEAPAPAPQPAAAPAGEADAGEEAAPKRARRRRSPREVMDALGSEVDGGAE